MQHRLQGTEATWDTSHLEAWGGVQGGTVTISARVLILRTLWHPGTTGEIPKAPRLVIPGFGGLEAKGQLGTKEAPSQVLQPPQTQFLGLWRS